MKKKHAVTLRGAAGELLKSFRIMEAIMRVLTKAHYLYCHVSPESMNPCSQSISRKYGLYRSFCLIETWHTNDAKKGFVLCRWHGH